MSDDSAAISFSKYMINQVHGNGFTMFHVEDSEGKIYGSFATMERAMELQEELNSDNVVNPSNN